MSDRTDLLLDLQKFVCRSHYVAKTLNSPGAAVYVDVTLAGLGAELRDEPVAEGFCLSKEGTHVEQAIVIKVLFV